MILSVNHDPNSDAKCAWHRAIWKGQVPELKNEIEALKAEKRKISYTLDDDWAGIERALAEQKVALKEMSVPDRWNIEANEELYFDLKLIWKEFRNILSQNSGSGGCYQDFVVVVAISETKLDLIFSKDGFRPFHKFYHWQAVSQGVVKPKLNDSRTHLFYSQLELEDEGEDTLMDTSTPMHKDECTSTDNY
jgi:hypothetical protein